jgi:crotonobetainyl-CoA:carnitine CoA-transferase CaiB-like acyl-CoA transferase
VKSADRPFVIAAANDRLFARLSDIVGRPDLTVDQRFRSNEQRRANVDDLMAQLEATFTTHPSGWWVERPQAAGVPAGPINTIPEALAWAEERGLSPSYSSSGTAVLRIRATSTAGCLRSVDRHHDQTAGRCDER